MKILILAAVFGAFLTEAHSTWAKEDSKQEDALKPLKQTLGRIKTAALTELTLQKKTVSDLSGIEKTSEALAYLSGAKFRFETTAPEKSRILYDGKTLWVINEPDPAFGGEPQIFRGRPGGEQKKKLLLSELLSQGKIVDSFDLKKTAEMDGLVSFEGTPRDKSLGVSRISVQVKNKELKSLEYVDEIGNKVSLMILKQKISGTPKANLFSFKPKKGAQVDDL